MMDARRGNGLLQRAAVINELEHDSGQPSW
jgi:hypothetical protein